MSRRHSSKFRKNQNKDKMQVGASSIGAAIFAKNPELADALVEKAKSKNNAVDRSKGGPRVCPRLNTSV